MIESLKPKSVNADNQIIFWRANPVQAAKDIFDVDMDWYQRIALNQMWFNNNQTNIFTRGGGKSFMNALCGSLEGILKPNYRVGFVGPGYRQAKVMWAELENLYQRSPLFQESVIKAPVSAPEKCSVKFKAAPGNISSVIEAIPLGVDGSKVRGQRYFSTYVDEAAQVEKSVLDVVVRGFGATSANPIKRIQMMREQQQMLDDGLITKAQMITPPSNRLIFSTTAFYQYNHAWERVSKTIEVLQQEYRNAVRLGEDTSRFVFQGAGLNDNQIPHRVMSNGKRGLLAFTYWDPSPGYMDMDTVENARLEMPEYQHKMEFECLRGDTEIMTPWGAKPISEIQIGDIVLTHKGRFRHVIETLIRDYSGPMVKLQSYGYNREVHITANHPMWTGGENWCDASTVSDHVNLSRMRECSGLKRIQVDEYAQHVSHAIVGETEYLYPTPGSVKNRKEFTATGIRKTSTVKKFKSSVKRHIDLNYDFGLVIGWYAAEGSIGADGRLVEFSLDGHHDAGLDAFIAELQGAIERSFDHGSKIYRSGPCAKVGINSRLLVEVISTICPGTASEKHIQPKILFSNPEFMRGFLVGYWHGDGCINDKPQASVGSTSRDLLIQVKMVQDYFGFPSALRQTLEAGERNVMGRTCQCHAFHSLVIRGDYSRRFATEIYGVNLPVKNYAHESLISCDDEKSSFAIDTKSTYHYEGKVYNLEVAEDHSYSLPNATVHNCFFPSDSMGFYRRSMLEKCRGHNEFGPILEPRKGCTYVMGIDPARTSDNFSIAIFEIDFEAGMIRLVRVMSWNNKEFPLVHREVRWVIKHYKITYFQMDGQGGGSTFRDLLASPENCPAGERLILEQEWPDHQFLTGDRILGPLVQFANGQWVHDANNNLLSALQHGRLQIAAKAPLEGQIWTQELEDASDEIERTVSEMSNIVTTMAGSRMHWDTPTKKMRKDRYSAVLIGFNAAEKILGMHNKPQSLAIGFFG